MVVTAFRERAWLVHLWKPRESSRARDDAVHELEALARTAGVAIAGQVSFEVRYPSPALGMGKGQAEQVAQQCQTQKLDVVLVDRDLKPMQQRNLERLTGGKVIDRTGLILDIFAQRAKSQEGQLQVELAQLSYLLPRLSGQGTGLSQMGGGIGTRGPGEQKLEMDRRRIRYRMTVLRKAIEGVRRHRAIQRESRREVPLSSVTLVGYTNAGKSTLLNRLTQAEGFTQDLLFATLDPTTRRARLPRHGEVLLTDTVGFIQDLSIHLIAAFKATLEEVAQAELLLYVLDASHHAIEEHDRTVRKVLKDLGADRIPHIVVLNKADHLTQEDRVAMERKYPGSIALSALTGEGCSALMVEIERRLEDRRLHVSVRIPYAETKVQAMLHQFGTIERESYEPQGIDIDAWVDAKFASRLKPYRQMAG